MKILTFFGIFAIVAMIVTVCSRGLCETHKKSALIVRVIGISLAIAVLVFGLFGLATVVSGLNNTVVDCAHSESIEAEESYCTFCGEQLACAHIIAIAEGKNYCADCGTQLNNLLCQRCKNAISEEDWRCDSCTFITPKFQDLALAISLGVIAVGFTAVVLGVWCDKKAEKEKAEKRE